MTIILVRSFACLLLLGAASIDPALAQVRGVVTDPTGVPLPDALVELWSVERRLAGQLTDARGEFAFAAIGPVPSLTLLIRRIGYSPARVAVSHGRIEVRLTRFAEVMRPISVLAGRLCPRPEDPTARAVWVALAERYSRDRALAHWAEPLVSVAIVRPEQLGLVDTARLTASEIGAGRAYFELASRLIAERGYAIPYEGLRLARYDLWEYPYLESLYAAHFVDTLFGRLHNLAWASGASREIVFCPRDTSKPSIQGHLILDGHGALERVRWQFNTPAPAEIAGGEVIFTRPGEESSTALLPMAGLFWRKRVFDYWQQWFEFREWRTCASRPDARFCE